MRGFRKILTGRRIPDFHPLLPGVPGGHGSGYQDQSSIEARDFRPRHRDRRSDLANLSATGHAVNEIVAAAFASSETEIMADHRLSRAQ